MIPIEKNVFENIFNTMMNVDRKTKDNAKSRLDLMEICHRPELHVVDGKVSKSLLYIRQKWSK